MLINFQLAILDELVVRERRAADERTANLDLGAAAWHELGARDAIRLKRLLGRRRERGLWRGEAFSNHLAIAAHFNP